MMINSGKASRRRKKRCWERSTLFAVVLSKMDWGNVDSWKMYNVSFRLNNREICAVIKVSPQYCIAHPYCARFRGISTRKLARARTDNERNFPQA